MEHDDAQRVLWQTALATAIALEFLATGECGLTSLNGRPSVSKGPGLLNLSLNGRIRLIVSPHVGCTRRRATSKNLRFTKDVGLEEWTPNFLVGGSIHGEAIS
jgi:hypothetical protein